MDNMTKLSSQVGALPPFLPPSLPSSFSLPMALQVRDMLRQVFYLDLERERKVDWEKLI